MSIYDIGKLFFVYDFPCVSTMMVIFKDLYIVTQDEFSKSQMLVVYATLLWALALQEYTCALDWSWMWLIWSAKSVLSSFKTGVEV